MNDELKKTSGCGNAAQDDSKSPVAGGVYPRGADHSESWIISTIELARARQDDAQRECSGLALSMWLMP